jgi:hypothetical protein
MKFLPFNKRLTHQHQTRKIRVSKTLDLTLFHSYLSEKKKKKKKKTAQPPMHRPPRRRRHCPTLETSSFTGKFNLSLRQFSSFSGSSSSSNSTGKVHNSPQKQLKPQKISRFRRIHAKSVRYTRAPKKSDLPELLAVVFNATDPNDVAILNLFKKNLKNPELLKLLENDVDPFNSMILQIFQIWVSKSGLVKCLIKLLSLSLPLLGSKI